MFGIDENTLVFLSHIIPMTTTDHALLDLPFAPQVNENGTSLSLELIVEQITLKKCKLRFTFQYVLSYFVFTTQLCNSFPGTAIFFQKSTYHLISSRIALVKVVKFLGNPFLLDNRAVSHDLLRRTTFLTLKEIHQLRY